MAETIEVGTGWQVIENRTFTEPVVVVQPWAESNLMFQNNRIFASRSAGIEIDRQPMPAAYERLRRLRLYGPRMRRLYRFARLSAPEPSRVAIVGNFFKIVDP